MKTATAALLLALVTAACSPTDQGIPTAQAQQPAASGSTVASGNTVAYPQVAEGSADGQVYEYY